MLQRLPVAGSLILRSSSWWIFENLLLTQVFTLGVVSSSAFWWRYCVTVRIGNIVVNCLRYHYSVRNWLLRRASRCSRCGKDSPARLLMLENKGFTSAQETDKLLWVNVAWSWCWPALSVVSICLLWMILLWECLTAAVLCKRIWFESLDLHWCGHKANPNQHDVCVIHDALQDFCLYLFVLLQLLCLRKCIMKFVRWIIVRSEVHNQMSTNGSWCFRIWVWWTGLESPPACAIYLWWCPTNSLLDCPPFVILHQAI